jgi:hypothetical protein
MIFERNEAGQFLINGTVIPRDIFLAMEPNYTEPEGTIFVHYEQGIGRRIRTNVKEYKIGGAWDDGDRYIKRISQFSQASTSLSIEAQKQEAEIVQSKLDSIPNYDRRRFDYPPLEDLIVALWENLIEKKTKKASGVEAIQKLRKAVKDKYPTENNNAISQDETEIS